MPSLSPVEMELIFERYKSTVVRSIIFNLAIPKLYIFSSQPAMFFKYELIVIKMVLIRHFAAPRKFPHFPP